MWGGAHTETESKERRSEVSVNNSSEVGSEMYKKNNWSVISDIIIHA